ncbi:MAG: DUF2092 domain-containing protein [Gammaproteobacteria bacterium]|nr:DUF2092 domain-containing protein [Gammaproteobacteria bacterium]
MKLKTSGLKSCSIFLLTLSSLSFTTAAWSEGIDSKATELEPRAVQIFKNMSKYLGSLKQFSVTSHSTIESMLDSGQKIMIDHYNTNAVHRPDKLYGERKGDAVDQKFYYNGKTFTLYNNVNEQYKTVNAPDNITQALDFSLQKFNLTAPGADLLYKDSYDRLSKNLLSGFYVDKTIIDGVECHHLAFRNTEVDWQIWISTGIKPLPKRYVVTSRWITGSPQFVLDMNWNTNPDFTDDIFNFIAPDKK